MSTTATQCHPEDRVGLFCFKCLRSDFGGSVRRLSSHRQHCNGPKNSHHHDSSRSRKKRKVVHQTNVEFSTTHSNGMSQFPFLAKNRSLVDHQNEVCFTNPSDYPNFEIGDSDDTVCLDTMNSEVTDVIDALVLSNPISNNSDNSSRLHHPSKAPITKATKPFNINAALPSCVTFQMELARICDRHRTNLKLFTEVNQLIKKHSIGRELSFSSDNLANRNRFVKKLGTCFQTETLKHKDISVPLELGGYAVTPVFDLEAQIMSLLLDESLMHPDNLAEGYDIFTGKATGPCLHYGEIHTGDAWEPARKYFCGDNYPNNLPVALVVFADESHFDQKGTLKTMPMMFTLSLFNQKARNDVRFWRIMGYIPNLGYGATTKEDQRPINTKTPATHKLQNEHNCIAAILEPLVQISKRGGIRMTVKGYPVTAKVWIHFFIGDTSGNNRWLGHFNSGANIQRPYRDCACDIDDMDNANPTCTYLTRGDYHGHISLRSCLEGTREKLDLDSSLSKNPIRNAFMNENVPLSDLTCGIYRMTPPERLHTTCEGCTKYMFESLLKTILNCTDGCNLIREIENEHFTIHFEWSRNSERDYPRSAGRNGLMNQSKVNGSERRGNLLRLLCLSHTDAIKHSLSKNLRAQSRTIFFLKFQKCLKLYLSMEELFHDSNLKEEVAASRPLVAETINLMKSVFPREAGRGWNLPKLHGLTKFQPYMMLYGSASNFFGGVGESNHKRFVKDTGNNTQLRANIFSSQIASRYYERMVCDIADIALDEKIKSQYYETQPRSSSTHTYPVMEGKYQFSLNINSDGFTDPVMSNQKKPPVKFVESVVKYLSHRDARSRQYKIIGYTACKLELDGREEIFRAISNYGCDGEWYDWCLIKWDGYNETYPARILGFFHYNNDPCVMVVVQSSPETSPMSMDRMSRDFVSNFSMPEDLDDFTYVVPIDTRLCIPRGIPRNSPEFPFLPSG